AMTDRAGFIVWGGESGEEMFRLRDSIDMGLFCLYCVRVDKVNRTASERHAKRASGFYPY
ncbi:MAG: hypothetical protein LBS99_03945, partial [Clostridiales bacterium]|nr:hypothetical protein [Clostridiales bacterium]